MNLAECDPELNKLIEKEEKRQNETINLVASENHVSKAVREATASALTNKYAEGYPRKRYYGGTALIDEVEQIAIDRAKKLFGAEHVNVQPYSGTNPNLAVYFSVLEPGETAMAMNLQAGGHLSHGSPMSVSGKVFRFVFYGVNRETELLDYDEIKSIAQKEKPKLIVAGASAYSRLIDYKIFREIADKVGALLLVDMAHIAGLVAAKVIPSPVPYAHFVTSSTHKTLRGPRGGLIICKSEFAEKIDRMVFPGLQGGPLESIIAAKAVAFHEASQPEFVAYARQVISNAKTLADQLAKNGFRLVSSGTDNHLLNVDFGENGITGREAEMYLEQANIIVNREIVPRDTRKPYIASGIRLGSSVVTTRGFKKEQVRQVADLITLVLRAKKDTKTLKAVRKEVDFLTKKFPFSD